MILVTGLYDEFIAGIADVTRLRFTKRNVLFLAILLAAAGIAIVAMAGTLGRAVALHRSAMYSLFIGLTLGGAPLLVRMIRGFNRRSIAGVVVGLGLMVAVALTAQSPGDREALRASVAEGRFVIEPNYPRDLAAGALGMSAMVLPGISGAYMLLILDRYETILAAIAQAKDFVFATPKRGDSTAGLHVLIPVAVGSLISLVLVSNVLRWLLRRHERLMLGLLLGILLGSVIGIWPFDAACGLNDYVLGVVLAGAGFLFTVCLARLNA